ncbi:outer membrane receptor protein [Bernardetia litoralis DSM 6794]|uniref:Outer membrane receptor protein n=1 Tax=Bernardetia litoralis (strain ATCC 23117 / DSM 6794 / NBRC 15988 / NCIMB 1366 / Fx l1 / Sio-4) TaxID=880071 RepID=I4AQ14_BERLS|nr:TonB-dependent receptor [Bernardetia litoralis]AFM06049.1 outer membrane receptor protein [Bernardetia litoralis DSM 6794]
MKRNHTHFLCVLTLSLTFILSLFYQNNLFAQQEASYTLSGKIRDAANGEELIGATVLVEKIPGTGAVANEYGFYSLTLPTEKYRIIVSYIGFENQIFEIDLTKNITLNIEMSEASNLKEVVVTSKKDADANITEVQMSTQVLEVEQVKKLPALLGEVDVMRTLTLLPGVQSAGEGTGGIFVRGGSNDQNLILLDDAPVYNASHLLGFFSVFNGDAIKSVKLYKGGIPAQYGGRLSSIIDIRMKNGNNKKFTSSGGIGTVSSRLTVEAPINEKSSFILSGRRTYADQFLRFAKDTSLRENKLYFYDFNAKANYEISDKDRIYLSGYFGRDVFKFGENFGLNWGNATATFRWNHIFNQKLFLNTTAVYSNFNYGFEIDDETRNFTWDSGITDYSVKLDFDYFINPKNTMTFGMENTYHHFNPAEIKPKNESSIFNEFVLSDKFALENAFYLANEQQINHFLTLQYGLRLSMFQNLGKTDEYQYADGQPKIDANITDTLSYDNLEPYSFYAGLEPRLALNFKLNDVSAIKLSYNRTRQYLQTVSTNTASLPFDRWIPTNKYIDPQISDQIALGYFRNFANNKWEASIEGYYKNMQNQIDVKDGADLLLNDNIEEALAAGKAWSYGLEFYLKKNYGKTTGWVSYTLSTTQRQIEEINLGNAYSPRYNQPHNLAVVVAHQFSPRVTLAGNFIFTSGAAVSFPVGRYKAGNDVIDYFQAGKRNDSRLPDYHRADISLTIDGKHRKNWKGSWNFSIYNFYNRKNAFSISFREKEDENGDGTGEYEAVKTTLFGIIPSITYNFKFSFDKK